MGHERYAGRLLLIGTGLQGLNNYLIPAMLHAMEHMPAHVFDTPASLQVIGEFYMEKHTSIKIFNLLSDL